MVKNIFNKSINKKIFIVILFIILVFILSKILAFNNKTVDISNYINVTYTGLETIGKVNCTVDEDKLYTQLAGNEKNTEVLSNIKQTIDSISITTKGSNLSNGNSVNINVTYNKDLAKKAKCSFRNLKYSTKVSGLAVGKTIDIFDNVEVIIAGISPEAYANVNNKWSEEALKNISFSIDHPTNISKGDVVKVTCNATEDDMTALGYILKNYTKEYKVDTVNSYISDSSQIDTQLLKTIKYEAINTIKTETENTKFRMFYKATNDKTYLYQNNTEWINNSQLVKAVLLMKKDSAVNTNNYIYLLFKSNVSNDNTTTDMYFAFEYTDGIVTNSGEFSIAHNDEANRYICGMNYEEIYSKVVLSKENSYSIKEITGLE